MKIGACGKGLKLESGWNCAVHECQLLSHDMVHLVVSDMTGVFSMVALRHCHERPHATEHGFFSCGQREVRLTEVKITASGTVLTGLIALFPHCMCVF